jgi:hypothetical protein
MPWETIEAYGPDMSPIMATVYGAFPLALWFTALLVAPPLLLHADAARARPDAITTPRTRRCGENILNLCTLPPQE